MGKVTSKRSNEKEILEGLIEKGKHQGYLTYDDVNDFLPNNVVSAGEIDDILMTLGDHDIDVVDSLKRADMQESVGGEEGKDKEQTAGKADKTDDPVRMYLREMGRVPLLSKADEVRVAKQIEEAEKKLREKLRAYFKRGRCIPVEVFVAGLNRLVRGWVNYYHIPHVII